MAKGFTVKAKTPTVSKPAEWDYDRAKELVKGKSVVFKIDNADTIKSIMYDLDIHAEVTV